MNEALCIGCECTDSRACPGGCSWLHVDYEAGYGICSGCPEVYEEFVLRVAGDEDGQQGIEGRPGPRGVRTMKSLELINKLNKDPALRMSEGITAGKLAERIRTLIELGKLDRDAQVFFEDATIVSAVAEDDGESFVLTDVLEDEVSKEPTS